MTARIHPTGVVALVGIWLLLVAFTVAIILTAGTGAAVAATLPLIAKTDYDPSDFLEPFDTLDGRYRAFEEDGELVVYDRENEKAWMSSTVDFDPQEVA